MSSIQRSGDPSATVVAPNRWLTVPNALCLVRLVGSMALVPLAIVGNPIVFLASFVALSATDWIDGKIARWFDQRSQIGPKLDSLADITMYVGLLFGTVWMFGADLLGERIVIGAAVTSYVGSCLASLLKFRQLPAYHSRGAKISWFLTMVAAIALFTEWSLWPLRIAAGFVTLTNLEAILITCVLRQRAEDVETVFHALRGERPSESPPNSR